MNKQLSLFDGSEPVGDSHKKVSPTNPVGDTENQAFQRYLDRAKVSSRACIKKYQPNGRKTKYFRLDYRVGKKTKSIHIPGGNIDAKLAKFRAGELQEIIDRGAELGEIMAKIEDYRSGQK